MLKKLISLHKYWIHCNICYTGFKEYMSTNVDKIAEHIKEQDFMKFHLLNLDHHGFFRSYWYSSLYVVIEGYRDINLKVAEIDDLLQQKEFVNKLRLFRNSIFHFQNEIYSEKFLGVDDSDEFVAWIYKLHRTLGVKIVEEMHKLVPPEVSQQIRDLTREISRESR